jgi:acyl-CoA reductase-like NAD-dependent aldehyde dehydrogenase
MVSCRSMCLATSEKGEETGAKIAFQRDLPTDEKYKNGFFVRPTLFRDVTRDMIISHDEMFGPVVTVTSFDTEEEAVSITNESKYGLTNIFYSRDNEKCLRTARKIDAGMVFVNNYFRNLLGTPFSGAKHSGYGREHCIGALREWSRAKTIRQPSGLGQVPDWRGVKDIFDESGTETT